MKNSVSASRLSPLGSFPKHLSDVYLISHSPTAAYDPAQVSGPNGVFAMMSGARVLFCRRYRAALLDYLLGSGETALVRAYDLGRRALDDGLGLLQVLRAHQRALDAVLESMPTVKEGLSRLKAAEVFLMETLSPFEMTYRGYVSLLQGPHEARRHQSRHRPSVRRKG